MSPPGLANGIADALIKASPQVLFLLFGRRGILSSAPLWESILYPPLYINIIDQGIRFLFNWHAKNITVAQKLAAYPHLYSYTSTKSVVHWFQIIRTKSFQMYDDDPPLSLSNSTRFTKVARYPTRNIKTPIVLVYGGSDSLVDIRAMLRELPPTTVATEIPHYEHLDFLWARDVAAQVFPHVFDALDSFTGPEHSRDEYATYRRARGQSLSRSGTFWKHARNGSDVNDSDVNIAIANNNNQNNTTSEKQPHQAREDILRSNSHVQFSDDDAASTITTDPSELGGSSPHPNIRPRTARKGSSDNGAPELGSPAALKVRTSSGSLRSAMKTGASTRGISLGASRAVGGVNTTDATSVGSSQISSDEGKIKGRKAS